MTQLVGHVEQLWQYPVKSMAGVGLPRAELGRNGLLGDRGWCAREEELGQLTVVRRTPKLLLCRATYEIAKDPDRSFRAGQIPPVRITLPDGASFSSTDADAADRLSEFLGKRISLWPLQKKSKLKHYRLAKPQGAREFRRQFASKSLPDLSSIPFSKILELMLFVTPLGSYYDLAPLHILSSSALAHMRRIDPKAEFRVERFRPNIFVKSLDDDNGLDDFSWVHGQLQLGDAEVRCRSRTVRCSAPAQPMLTGLTDKEARICSGPQKGFEKDGGVLRAIERETGRHLGIYASVKTPGLVRVGDPVYWVPAKGKPREGLSTYQRLRNRVLHASLESVDRFGR